MQYKYCANNNFEDLSSGRVIYGNAGIPNFSVRLTNEIFRRCIEYTEEKAGLVVYDPCCGGGYSLTVLGFCNADRISSLIGSDIDEKMVEYSRKNTALLTKKGLHMRILEIESMVQQYNKASHIATLESSERWKESLREDIPSTIFQADCTKILPKCGEVDVIITDAPYGKMVDWKGDKENPLDAMMSQCAKVSNKGTVMSICMDKKQQIHSMYWKRVEKQIIGKRKFEIYKLI